MTGKEFHAHLTQNSKCVFKYICMFIVKIVTVVAYFSFSDFSTVYEDQLQKHLKKCNSREKPKPVSVM